MLLDNYSLCTVGFCQPAVGHIGQWLGWSGGQLSVVSAAASVRAGADAASCRQGRVDTSRVRVVSRPVPVVCGAMLRHARVFRTASCRSCRYTQCRRFGASSGRDTSRGAVGVGTASVWAGEEKYIVERATQVPIVNAVGYGYDNVDEWYAVATGDAEGHIYSRNTNPTVRAFEKKAQALEGAEDAIAFSSGMAAISNTLFALLKPGDRVVSIKDSYGGTSLLFLEFLPKYGVEVDLVETSDFAAIEAAVSAAPTALLYLETPTNPTLKVVDIARLAAHAKKTWGSIVCVDNTFATPVNQLPLTLGADIVLHSASKFLGGHADALGGIAAGEKQLIRKIYHWREIHGACLDPGAAYALLRGMKTLELRVQRQNTSAMAVAEYLMAHPAVRPPCSVVYPRAVYARWCQCHRVLFAAAEILSKRWPARSAHVFVVRCAWLCRLRRCVIQGCRPTRTTKLPRHKCSEVTGACSAFRSSEEWTP